MAESMVTSPTVLAPCDALDHCFEVGTLARAAWAVIENSDMAEGSTEFADVSRILLLIEERVGALATTIDSVTSAGTHAWVDWPPIVERVEAEPL